MDAFVKVKKSLTTHDGGKPDLKLKKASSQAKAREVIDLTLDSDDEVDVPQPVSKSTSRTIAAKDTSHLLKTLKDKTNPITHSRAHAQSEFVSSCCTGHERAEEGHASSYVKERGRKLGEQQKANVSAAESSGQGSGVLRGVRAYLGFCEDTTDVELRHVVALAGGVVTYNQSSATHIITSQWLSGSKTHRMLTTQKRKKFHVVTPAWIFDSVERKKRQSEWRYTQVEIGTQRSVLSACSAP